MEKRHSYNIVILVVFFSSALIGTLLPMKEELETSTIITVTAAQIEFISSLFLVVGACSSLIWAILSSRFSRKKLLLIAILEWSICAALTGLANNFISLLIFQLMTAIGFGAIIPITFSLIVDLKKPKERGFAFGWKETNYVLGIGFAQILSGFLIEHYPWFVPFLVISIGGFACAFLVAQMTPPTKGEMDNVNGRSDISATWIRREDLKLIIQKKSNAFILIFNLALFIGLGAVSINLSHLLSNATDHNFSIETATIFLVIIYVTQIPSGALLGKLSDKTYKSDVNGRIKIAILCLIIGASLYIIGFSMNFKSTAPIGIIAIFLLITGAGAFFFGGIDPLLQATIGEINTPQLRSTMYSLNYLAFTFGRSISLLVLMGLASSFGFYRLGFVILSIISLASTIFLIPLLKTVPRELYVTE
ncbi:MAG: MFS transporter [Promethearchaeota archaeon]|nr:MAG: MFS transporter [Candidatus Lokiarchaeota archaeon]